MYIPNVSYVFLMYFDSGKKSLYFEKSTEKAENRNLKTEKFENFWIFRISANNSIKCYILLNPMVAVDKAPQNLQNGK